MKALQEIATQVRRDVLRMVHAAQSGHPGGSMGTADFMTALYFNILRHKPQPFDMNGYGQDIFILSNGHISPVFYSVLARSGYFPLEELKTFRKINSRLQGHPAVEEGLPGIRIATGSLGQGLSVAIGAAMAKKLNDDNHLIFTLQGDGEMQEGQIWEALMFAAHHQIDNLIMTVDYNGQQIDGRTADVMSLGDLPGKLRSFGWKTIETDGNNWETLLPALNEAVALTGNHQPVAIVMHTIMSKGVDFMENDHRWHGVAPNDEQLARALAQLPETLGDF